MPMSNEEKARTLGLAQVERLQSEGMTAIEQGGDANAVADQLLALSQQTADAMVSEVAMRGARWNRQRTAGGGRRGLSVGQ